MTSKPSTTIFLFHPSLETSRVNRALIQQAAKLETVNIRDIYALYPDGVIDVAREQEAAEASQRIVLQFPMQWYSCPPLAKQWLDDVLAYGWAYGSSGNALHGKELALAVSAGSPKYTHDGVGYTPTELLRPFQATSNLIGTTFLTPFFIEGSLGLSDATLSQHALAYKEFLTSAQKVLDLHG